MSRGSSSQTQMHSKAQSPWDFTQALELISTLASPSPRVEKRDLQYRGPIHDSDHQSGDVSTGDGNVSSHKTNGFAKVGLGDFSRLWQYLGHEPEDVVLSEVPPAGNHQQPSLLGIIPPDKPSYISDGAVDRPPSTKAVTFKDETEDAASVEEMPKEKGLTKTQRKKARRRARAEAAEREATRQRTASDFESEADIPHTPARKASVHNVATPQSQTNYNLRPKDAAENVITSPGNDDRQPEPVTATRTTLLATSSQKDTSPVTPVKPASVAHNAAPQTVPTKKHSTSHSPQTFSTPVQPKPHPSQQLQAALQAGYQHHLPPHIAHTTSPAFSHIAQQPQWLQPGFLHPPAATTPAIAAGKQQRTKPLVIREGDDRNWALRLKLLHDFGEDKKWLTAPVPLANHTKTPNGIHVFIDYSNIWIGFMELVKRLTGLHPKARTPHSNLSFDSLVLLLERGRPVAKRILGGSAPFLPAFETARAIGYELNILDKVFKAKELTERQRRFAIKSHYGGAAGTTSEGSGSETGGASSSTPTPAHAPEKWVEQGVDEILHLKLLESIVDAADTEVSTIVLATGDAAEAEYSAGFMKMVERALKKGWKVELVSWSKGMSYLYRKREFLERWRESFKVVDLDEFAEYLLDT